MVLVGNVPPGFADEFAMTPKLFILHVLCWGLFTSQVHARDIELFDASGERVANYDELVQGIREGDVMRFADGEAFVVESRLGHGDTTQVLRVHRPGAEAEAFALRVRLSRRIPNDFINMMITAHPTLEQAGVRVPRMRGNLRNQYVLMEVVPHDFDGRQFLRMLDQPPGGGQARDALMGRARQAFLRFARETATVSAIGDFRPEQMVYSVANDRWTLLDWTFADRLQGPAAGDYTGAFRHWTMMGETPQQAEFVEEVRASVRQGLSLPSCLSRVLRGFFH